MTEVVEEESSDQTSTYFTCIEVEEEEEESNQTITYFTFIEVEKEEEESNQTITYIMCIKVKEKVQITSDDQTITCLTTCTAIINDTTRTTEEAEEKDRSTKE